MGNCLRLLEVIRAAEQDSADDTTLLDPGNYGENLQVPNVDESESSDESPLFFRMLNRSSRRRANTRRSRSATYHADTGRITTGSSRPSRRRNRARTGTTGNQNFATVSDVQLAGQGEAGQILLAQRLGLIQHLPLIVWEGKRAKKQTHTTNTLEADQQSQQQQQQLIPQQNQSSSSSSPIIRADQSNADNTTTTSETEPNQAPPPSYEKSGILPTTFNQHDTSTSTSNPTQHVPDSNSSSDKDENECTICMEDFEEGEHIRYLPCMHFYHQACIDSWLMRSFTCPRCMEAVDSGIMASFAQQLS